MTKENVLFGIIGLLLGCIVGFVFATTVNNRGYSPAPAAPGPTAGQQQLPADHPPIDQGGAGTDANAGTTGQPPEIAAKIKAAKDDPANFDAQMEAAKLFYQIQRYPDAIGYLQKAVAIKPKDFDALSALGNVNFDSGNFAEAEKWYKSALEVKPDSVEVRTDLGSTYMQRTPPDPATAIGYYQASLKINPNHELTLINLVRAYTAQKNLAQAQAALDKLAQVNPNSTELAGLRTQLQQAGGK